MNSSCIRRDSYLEKLKERMGNGLVKTITGTRGCGKSFLLFRIFRNYLIEKGTDENHIIEVTLDDDVHTHLRDPYELSRYIRSKITDGSTYYILIDEVQYAISREELSSGEDVRLYDVLNGLLRYENVDIYVTGSNSKMLTRDVLTSFRGRGDEIRIYPLSFREYHEWRNIDRRDAYDEYMLWGGMPPVVTQKSPEDKEKVLRRLLDYVFMRDIRERYRIDLPEVLDNLTDDMCSSIGSLTNSAKITRYLQSTKGIKVSRNTIHSYIGYLQDCFLFSEAKRYDIKGKKYFDYPSKYYATDTGLRNIRLNMRQVEETHLMENIIYNELLLRGYSVDVGVVELSEAGKRKQCEIDFVVNRGFRRYYIQSALDMSDEKKSETELRPFMNINDSFRKIVISKTSLPAWMDEQGTVHMGIYEFLLDQNSLNI